MTKKRILHILNTSSYSGAENVVITIMRHMRHEADLVYVSPDGPIRKIVEGYGLTFFGISKLCRVELRRAIQELKPDIIHAHDYTAGIIAAISTWSIPIVNHLHNNSPWIKRYGVYSFVYALASLKMKKILMVSNSIINEYVFGGLVANKSKTIGNPVDLNHIRKAVHKASINDCSDVIFIGRLSKQKNPLLFLDIIEKIAKSNKNLKVAMVGDGELADEVKSGIRIRNLSDVVTMYGFVQNPYGLLANSKLLCVTSTWEGYGLVAVEALSLGKPVVASNVGGIPSIISAGVGRLCSSIDSFVAAIEKYLYDDECYQTEAQQAKTRAEELMDLSAYFEKIKASYQ